MTIYVIMITVSMFFAYLAVHSTQTYSFKLALNSKNTKDIKDIKSPVADYKVKINKYNLYALLSFLPLFLVSALRYKVGVDYMSYSWIFDAVKNGEKIHAEKGYRFLNELMIFFTDNSQSIFIITSLITLLLIFYGIYKNSPSPALSIFLFVTMGYLFSSFNILRQYIAVALIFASLKLIKEKRLLAFIAVIFVGMLFHKTTIIMLPLYFLLRLRLKHSYLCILTLLAACCVPLQRVLINVLIKLFYPQYVGTQLIKPLEPFEFIYYLVVLGLLVLMCAAYKNTIFNDDTNLILFNSIFFSLIAYTCFYFVPEINRIAIYFELYVILLIPRIICAEKNVKTRRFYYAVTIAFFLAFFVLSVGIMGRFGVLPYQTIFSKL